MCRTKRQCTQNLSMRLVIIYSHFDEYFSLISASNVRRINETSTFMCDGWKTHLKAVQRVIMREG